MSKIAVVIGHNTKAQGAVSPITGMSENKFMRAVCGDLIENMVNVDIFCREPIDSYTEQMESVVKVLNCADYDFVLELHHNAFNNSSVRGVECLVFYKSLSGKQIANIFNREMNKICGIPIRNNGIVEIKSSKSRGGYGIMKCRHPYVLIESHFGTSPKDCAIVNPLVVSNAIQELIKKWEQN